MGACFPFEAPHTEGLFKSSHRSFIVIFPLIRYLNFSLLGNYWFSLFTPCSLTYTLKLTASQLHHLCNSNNIWCRLNKQSVSDWKAQTTPADPDNTVTERDTRAICLLHMLSRAVARNSGPCALNLFAMGSPQNHVPWGVEVSRSQNHVHWGGGAVTQFHYCLVIYIQQAT